MSKFLKRNSQHLKEVDELLEAESGSPKYRALRETTSRLNRSLPMQQLLQALPEQSDESENSPYSGTFDRPTGLSEDTSTAGSSNNDTHSSSVMFGFQTPSKRRGRQSLLEIAITSSAQKKQQQQLNNASPPQHKTTQKSELEKTPTRHTSKRTPQKTPQHRTPSHRKGCSDVSPPVTPLTPALSRATLLTPKCVPKAANECCANTPRGRRSLVPQLLVEQPVTPSSFRKKVKTRIQEVAYDSDSDEDVSDVSSLGLDDSVEDETYAPDVTKSSTSDSQEDDDGLWHPEPHTLNKATRLTKAPSVKVIRKKRARHDEEEDKADQVTKDYFLHNAGTSSVSTSDHTLGRLAVPRLRTDALHSLMAKATLDHRQEREDLFEEHCGYFEEWMTMLGYGYSIGVHGVGSKKSLLMRFQQECLGDCDHIVVNGFFPSLTVKSILSCIIEEVLCLPSPPATPAEQLQLLRRHYGGRFSSPLYLLLHNMDGPMLRTSASQHTLSLLCSLPRVRLVASVDHVNAPLLLDSRRSAEFNLLWYDCTTFAQYLEETSYENSLLVQQSASLALSSLVHVFKSLTPSAKGIFLLLAEYQLQHKQEGSYTGLSFAELYHRCRERLLVNSELTLRAQLTEFLDHRLVRNKKGADGGECLVVPLEEEALRNFVEEESGRNAVE